jgi:chromosome segregation protein
VFDKVRVYLKSALRTWYGFHWFRVQKQVTEAQAEAGQQAQRRDDLRAEQEGLDQLLLQSRGRIETLRAELHAFSQRMSARYAERETLGRRVAVAQERLRGLAEQDGVAKAETASLEAERDELLVRLTAARDETSGRQQTLFAAEEEFRRLQGPADLAELDREGLQERMAAARSRLEAALERRSAWRSELAQADARLQSLSAQAAETRLGRDAALAGAGASRDSVAREQRAAEGTQRALRSARDAERATREQLAHLEGALAGAEHELRETESMVATLDARRSALTDEAARQHQAPARLEQALKDGELSGAIGRLGAHVHPDPSLRAAVMAALGESVLGFVFRDQQSVDEALIWLAQAPHTGRVDLLPQAMIGTPAERLSAADCLGNAANLARPDEAVRAAVDHLLGQTLVVETREQARRVAAGLPAGSRVVTRNGEVFAPSGEVLVGAVDEGLPLEALAQVEAELQTAEVAREAKTASARTLRAEVETARGRLSEASHLAEEAAGLDQTARLRVEQVGFELRAKETQLENLSAAALRLTQEVERADEARGLSEERGLELQAEERQAQADVDALGLRLSGG